MEDTAGLQGGLGQIFTDQARGQSTFSGGLDLQEIHNAPDGTCKLLSSMHGDDTGALVETVVIPVERGGKTRWTICVSSQIGCAQRCQFCYTGRMGLRRNLNTAQIVEQVILAKRMLKEEAQPTSASDLSHFNSQKVNIVFMGMGEPLANLSAVMAATDIMCHTSGLQLSPNNVTVSTVGLVPQLLHLLHHSPAQLAVSLHATTDEVRDWLCPINRRYNLATLLGALAENFPSAPDPPSSRRFVLMEYVMLRDINDTLEDAHRLVQLLEPIYCKVNLICFNTHEGSSFRPSTAEALKAFQSIVGQSGRVCTVRESRGDDDMAACGQLGVVDQDSLIPLLTPPPHLKDKLLAVA